MRILFAVFDQDKLIEQSELLVETSTKQEHYPNSGLSIEHTLFESHALVLLSLAPEESGLQRVALHVPIHQSDDWESVSLGEFTFAFRCDLTKLASVTNNRVDGRPPMQTPRLIKLWDIGIRLFHWSLVLLMPLLWLLAEQGEAIADWASARGIYIDTMLWHARLGYVVLGLLVFRLLWGFVGSETARFAQFLRGPKVVLGYFRKQMNPSAADAPSIGHNPAGGWMVLVMLLLLIAQTVSGLFNFDDVDFEAPLYALVSETISDVMHDWHELNFDLMLIAIALHISAIVFYATVKKEQLVPPMIHGSRMLTTDYAPLMRGGWRLFCCALTGAAVVWWFWSF